MDMKKKGQMIIIYLMVAIIILIFAVNMIPVLKNNIDYSRNTSASLNCTDDSITMANKGTCIVLDMGLWYFISVCMAIGIALVAGKRTITSYLTVIFVFIVVVTLISPIKDMIVQARNSAHLDCTNAAISVGSKFLCLFVDMWLFYFVFTAIAASISYVVAKKVLKEE